MTVLSAGTTLLGFLDGQTMRHAPLWRRFSGVADMASQTGDDVANTIGPESACAPWRPSCR
jgi:hypothetical protein